MGFHPDTLLFGGTITGNLVVTGNFTVQGNFTFGDAAVDNMSINGAVTYATGAAITAGSYQIQRDADATNQLHFNVPTGASMEWSVNDVRTLGLSSTLISIPSTGTSGLQLFNTADETVNSEALKLYWTSNVARVITQPANSGSNRSLVVGVYNSSPTGNLGIATFSNSAPFVSLFGISTSSGTTTLCSGSFSCSATSNQEIYYGWAGTSTMSSTAGYIHTQLKMTETTTGSGTKLLLQGMIGTTERFAFNNLGDLSITQAAGTTGTTALTIAPGAHTAHTASTELTDINFNLARTVTWATGNFALQRAFRIQAPTYAAAAASTIDDAVTFQVMPPVAGSNMTLTRAYAIRVVDDNTGTGTGNGVCVQNTTAATVGAVKHSPSIVLAGNCWETTGGTSQDVRFAIKVLPIQGTAATAQLQFHSSINGSAFTSRLAVSSSGAVTVGSLTANGSSAPLTVTQTGSSTSKMATFTAAAQVAMTASTEFEQFHINLGVTNTWATGALAEQSFVKITAPTIAFAAASTATDCSTFTITAAPTAGANATITNAYALWVKAGTAKFDGRLQMQQGADVASATNLTLGSDGNVFELTGTTKVDLISSVGWEEGSIVVLIANENVTIDHGTATSGTNVTILLAAAGDFNMTANDSLTLCLSSTTAGGQAWREIARTAI